MIEVLVRTELESRIKSREEYDEFVETVEKLLDTAEVLSVETGGETRIKIETTEDEFAETDYEDLFNSLENVEKIKSVEELAE